MRSLLKRVETLDAATLPNAPSTPKTRQRAWQAILLAARTGRDDVLSRFITAIDAPRIASLSDEQRRELVAALERNPHDSASSLAASIKSAFPSQAPTASVAAPKSPQCKEWLA